MARPLRLLLKIAIAVGLMALAIADGPGAWVVAQVEGDEAAVMLVGIVRFVVFFAGLLFVNVELWPHRVPRRARRWAQRRARGDFDGPGRGPDFAGEPTDPR